MSTVAVNVPSQVLTYANLAEFPATGVVKTIYISEDTEKTYRWNGSTYVEISQGSVGGVTSFNSRTGVVIPVSGDYTKSDVGLSNVDNTSDANKPISTATQTALNNKEPLKGSDDNYVTDAQLVVIGNTSGTNTGDQDLSGLSKQTISDLRYSGQWHFSPGSGAFSPIGSLANIIWFVPYYVGIDCTATDIGVEVATGAVTGEVKVALYEDDGTGEGVGNLIEGTAGLAATTSGFKSATFASSHNLLSSNKKYWRALQVNVYGVQIRYNTIISTNAPTVGASTSLKIISQAYGSFPASGSAAVSNTSVLNFKIGLKY